MHFDDQDVYIRRNLVALSTGILAVSILQVPVGQILRNLLSIPTTPEIDRVSFVLFGVFGYLALRMKVSAEGRRFRQRLLMAQKAITVVMFVRDINAWGQKYIRGAKEHPWVQERISRVLNKFWEDHGRDASTQRGPQSQMTIIYAYHNYPGTVTVRIGIASGTGDDSLRTGEPLNAKFTVTKEHQRRLWWRSMFAVNCLHKVGMEVTVPVALGLAAQIVVLCKLFAAYPPAVLPLCF